MFLDNKYTRIYFNIISRANARNYTKVKHDGYQTHHIIPRCFGGTDSLDNLAVLTYKEHRVCHRLLIGMTKGSSKHKMMYAYKLFNKNYDTSHLPSPQIYCTTESYIKMSNTRKRQGSYKRGKENVFSSPTIVEAVKQRMLTNNPMKSPEQRERMKMQNNNPHSKPVIVDGIRFPTLAAAVRHFNTTLFKLRKYHTIT